MAYSYTSPVGDEYAPEDIGKPINIDPLASLKDRPKFRTRKQQERAEKYAQALEQDATSTAPLGHWTQALSQVGKGILGGLEEREIDQSDADRRDYLAKALEGATSAEDLMEQGALYDVPELSDIGKYQSEKAWRQQQAQQAEDWRQKGYDLEREKFDYEKSKPVDAGFHILPDGTAVDDQGNVITKGPKPTSTKVTESEIKGASILQGAKHHADVLFNKGTPDNPVPGLDELATWQNTLARQAEGYGGSALMSESAQKTIDALRGLTQQYIYALSGQQAPESEVQRVLAGVIPSSVDQPGRVTEKKKEIANMWQTIQSRAAHQSATPDAGGGDPLAEARQAIQNGADPDAVKQRLIDNGIDPSGLD